MVVGMLVSTASLAITPDQLVTHQQDKLNNSIALEVNYKREKVQLTSTKDFVWNNVVLPAHEKKNVQYWNCVNPKPMKIQDLECLRYDSYVAAQLKADAKYEAVKAQLAAVDQHLMNLSVNIPAQRLELAEAIRKANDPKLREIQAITLTIQEQQGSLEYLEAKAASRLNEFYKVNAAFKTVYDTRQTFRAVYRNWIGDMYAKYPVVFPPWVAAKKADFNAKADEIRSKFDELKAENDKIQLEMEGYSSKIKATKASLNTLRAKLATLQ